MGYNQIDIQKAFDSLSWNFISIVLKYMNFSNWWIQKIMQCNNIVSYRIIIKGEHTLDFSPNKGVRQGDPLSSYIYIFIIFLNVLSCMLDIAK